MVTSVLAKGSDGGSNAHGAPSDLSGLVRQVGLWGFAHARVPGMSRKSGDERAQKPEPPLPSPTLAKMAMSHTAV